MRDRGGQSKRPSRATLRVQYHLPQYGYRKQSGVNPVQLLHTIGTLTGLDPLNAYSAFRHPLARGGAFGPVKGPVAGGAVYGPLGRGFKLPESWTGAVRPISKGGVHNFDLARNQRELYNFMHMQTKGAGGLKPFDQPLPGGSVMDAGESTRQAVNRWKQTLLGAKANMEGQRRQNWNSDYVIGKLIDHLASDSRLHPDRLPAPTPTMPKTFMPQRYSSLLYKRFPKNQQEIINNQIARDELFYNLRGGDMGISPVLGNPSEQRMGGGFRAGFKFAKNRAEDPTFRGLDNATFMQAMHELANPGANTASFAKWMRKNYLNNSGEIRPGTILGALALMGGISGAGLYGIHKNHGKVMNRNPGLYRRHK